MDLSSNLISEFAKITNDDSKKKSESTVYGTTIKYNDKMYVKIDGSDLLTPITTTADIKEHERVTIMIKDHSATVTGNITSPSASSGDVKKVTDTVDSMGTQITEFEIIVADKISTKEFDAEQARIDNLLAGKVTTEELEAVKATIKDLDVTQLRADVAEIELALIDKAEITDLNAVSAQIGLLEADFAKIETLIGGNLTMDNIQSLILTASKVTVDNAFIKDAMIDTVSANKVNAGVINTNNVNIASEDGSMILRGTLQQFKDENGIVRIQMGKDAQGNFTFAVFDETGTGTLIDSTGVKANAIADGLIVNDMISDTSPITGGKLDINSVISEINDNGSTTLKSSKVYLDDEKQTLDVVFNTMGTTVTDIGTTVEAHTTSLETHQGKIEGLITNTTITKEDGSTVSMKDDYASFKLDVNGLSNTISSLEKEQENVTSNVSKLTQNLNEFTTNIGSTIKTEIDTSLSDLNIGGVNLIDDSLLISVPITEEAATVNYEYKKLYDVDANVEYVLSIGSSELVAGTTNNYDIRLYNSTTNSYLKTWIIPISITKQIIRFTPTEACSLLVYAGPAASTIGNLITLNKVKLETGTICSEWTPSQNDENERLDGIENMFNMEDVINIYDDEGNIIDTQVRMTNIVDKLNTTSQTLDSTIERISATEQLLSADGEYGYVKEKFSEYIQTLESFDWTIGSTVNQNGEQIQRILTNISFSEDGITIGKSNSLIKMVIGNDKAAFIDSNGMELAYFSDDRLMISDASILGDLRIGNYGFFDDNGGITIGKVR